MRKNLGVLGLAVLLGGCGGSTDGDWYPFNEPVGDASSAGGAGGGDGSAAAGGSTGVDASAGSDGAAASGGSDAGGGDAAVPPDAKPTGAGIGQACSATVPCRAGLVCGSSQKCEASHSLAVGAACVASVECKTGSYCGPLKQCAAVGTGQAGATCASDADCADGLRCGFAGLSLECQTAGGIDVGGKCATSGDCLGGLVCAAGACASIPGGLPAPPPSWPGVTCEIETGLPVAWFRVPRGTADDKDFYRLPFPNDVRTKSGHPDLTGHPTPGTEPLGYDIVDRYLRAIEQDNDGFGAYPTAFFRFNQDLEFSTWNADAVQWIDVTVGAPEFGRGFGRSWGFSPNPDKYICARWLGVRPGQGEPLTPGHKYAVILTSVGKAKGGGAIAASDDFKAMMSGTAPASDASLVAAYPAYAPLRAYAAKLEAAKPDAGPDGGTGSWLDPSTFINAAVFTVGHVTDRAKNVAAAAIAAPLPSAITWSKCGVDAGMAQCSGGCAGADPAFDELNAVIPLPIFQNGTAPYLNDKGDIAAATAAPTIVRTENVCASLTIPKGAPMPGNGWPLLVFAHGTGGDYRSHVRDGVSKAMAGAATPIAVLGIDQVEHGSRRGGSTESPNNLFFNFANPRAARDNALQGAADQLSLANIAKGINIGGGATKINPKAMLFWGHSQGATEGAIGMPFYPGVKAAASDGGVPSSEGVKAVVLSGVGASLLDSLLTKTSPTNIAAAIPYVLQDPDPGNPAAVNGGGNNPVLSLLQTFFDPSDPLNFGLAMTEQPFAGKDPRHLFQVYGQGDTYSTGVTQATYARSARIWLVAHDPSVKTPDPIGDIKETASPVSSNMRSGQLTGAVREYAPASGEDGHFVAFKNTNANADVVRFLAQTTSTIPKIGP
jgi:hypothetical protein